VQTLVFFIVQTFQKPVEKTDFQQAVVMENRLSKACRDGKTDFAKACPDGKIVYY
jgi:hypothetical protein